MITPKDRRDLIEKLTANRKAFLELAKSLSEPQLVTPHKEGDRFPKGMLLHAAEAERSYVDRWARRARDEDSPDLNSRSEAPGEAALYNEAESMSREELLQRLNDARENTLKFIAETSDEEFDRVGRNTPFGDLSVHQFLKSLYRHDQMHIDEIQGKESAYVVTTTDGRRL
ncbi:MAG: DinB family protein [Dehalococcoidia bacterium]|nr:DinB family protein [Dehalococcoidia bacterium]